MGCGLIDISYCVNYFRDLGYTITLIIFMNIYVTILRIYDTRLFPPPFLLHTQIYKFECIPTNKVFLFYIFLIIRNLY